MLSEEKRVGDAVSCLYPTHGRLNVLRDVVGEIVKVGRGPRGPYITVQESNGQIRCLSLSKIVSNLN